MNLLCHQADKGGLPDDMEALAELAGVKYSDYTSFVECFKRTLKAKFEANLEAKAEVSLQNKKLAEVMKKDGQYQQRQSQRGKIGAFVRELNKEKQYSPSQIASIKEHLFLIPIDELTTKKMEDSLKHTLQALRTVTMTMTIDNEIEEGGMEETEHLAGAITLEELKADLLMGFTARESRQRAVKEKFRAHEYILTQEAHDDYVRGYISTVDGRTGGEWLEGRRRGREHFFNWMCVQIGKDLDASAKAKGKAANLVIDRGNF